MFACQYAREVFSLDKCSAFISQEGYSGARAKGPEEMNKEQPCPLGRLEARGSICHRVQWNVSCQFVMD